MKKKYKLTNETIGFFESKLFRIEALIDFGDVKAGDKGGFVESEKNLSQFGTAWVFDNAYVYGNAVVAGNAKVSGDSWVGDKAKVTGNAILNDELHVCDDSWVHGNAVLGGSTVVCRNAEISGNTELFNEFVEDLSFAEPNETLMTISPIGSENGELVVLRYKDGSIIVNRGCFWGTLEEFVEAINETHGSNGFAKQYMAAIELIKTRVDFEANSK